jgi:arylsulfatase A
MKNTITAAACASLALLSCTDQSKKQTLPNIVFILADDLGYGDLSCYGQQKFTTPNIDELSEEGMVFTNHYCGCAVSAPSRSSLMTGLHTGHTPIRGNKEWQPEGQWPLPADAFTIAELLRAQGYKTGGFGKWGLGFIDTEGDPNSQGFDEFYGYNCQRLAHNYYPYYLWHNHEKIILEANSGHKTGAYSADLIQKAALNFIEKNKKHPFFLYYPTTIPHAELFAKENYMELYRGRFNPEKSYKGVDDGPDYRMGPYGSQPEAHAAFAAMLKELDDYVGELLTKLREDGLDQNTIVIFASDNGPHMEGGGDPDYFDSNGELRGYKRDLYEGGIRTPLIIRWPGKIKAGSRSGLVSAFWDFLPTFAEITGAPLDFKTDGISFLPELLGKEQKKHDYLYWEFHEQGGKIAVRIGDWKAIQLNADISDDDITELYNLKSDVGETNNIMGEHPDIVKQAKEIIKSAHTTSDIFPFAFESKEK